jgi:AcrR family transcriptional regulator
MTAKAQEQRTGLRELNKQRRTDRIVDAALALLREGSAEKLTIERVAARAEVAPMTVFNLVGNREQLWTAMADRALADFDVHAIRADDPRERAHTIVESVVGVLRSDPTVFRALLSTWQSAQVFTHDPTNALIQCLRDAAASGHIDPEADIRRHGEVMTAGLLGTVHQWTAGVCSDRSFMTRAKAVVDVVFDAARV